MAAAGGGGGALPPLDPATAVVTPAAGASAEFVRAVTLWGGDEKRAEREAPGIVAAAQAPFQVTFAAGTCISSAHNGPLTLGVVRPLGHGCFKSVFEAHVMDADGNLQPDEGRFGLAICRGTDPLGLDKREVQCRLSARRGSS